jgi:hypothetical protein
MFYAGVGSRRTPPDVLGLMTRLATRLAALGFVLRSGGAEGADSAFEAGAGEAAQVFLPWPGFNGRRSYFCQPSAEALVMAGLLHPAWAHLSQGAQKLHARNCHQVLGPELQSPVLFVLCWTPDGAQTEADTSAATGGTGQAIRLASRQAIPVFNLQRSDSLAGLKQLLQRERVVG